MPKKDGTETVAEQEARFKQQGIEHFQSLPKNFNDALAGAVSSSEVSGQYELVEKDTLVGKPFVIIDWDFQMGDFQREYVNVKIINPQNEMLCFNDGGVGIAPVLHETEKGTKIVCKKGLRKSEYETVVEGKKLHGTTYYLA